jgi:hypothetical protein
VREDVANTNVALVLVLVLILILILILVLVLVLVLVIVGAAATGHRLAGIGAALSLLVTHVQRQIVDVLDLDECRHEHQWAAPASGAGLAGDARPADGRRRARRAADRRPGRAPRRARRRRPRQVPPDVTRVRRPDLDRRIVAVTLAQLVGAAVATSGADER